MDWQDVIVLAVVLAALAYVVRHVWVTGTRKKPTGCGACADCPAQVRRQNLVSIQPPARRDH